jgi:hypothetical protein
MATTNINAISEDSSGKFDGLSDFPETMRVQTLDASIVATGRKTGAIHDELWVTFATTH